jgi:hypothetical protein
VPRRAVEEGLEEVPLEKAAPDLELSFVRDRPGKPAKLPVFRTISESTISARAPAAFASAPV